MKKKFWISAGVILAGILILFLPDSGKPVIEFNKEHGPSLTDLVGLLVILGGWVYWLTEIIQQKIFVYRKLKSYGIILLGLLVVAGMTMVMAGLKKEDDALLFTGIILSALPYLVAALIAFRRL